MRIQLTLFDLDGWDFVSTVLVWLSRYDTPDLCFTDFFADDPNQG